MITAKNCVVSASFDSGTFSGCFAVSANEPTSYCATRTNIQSVYNLSFDDFTALEILIAHTVNDYLERKDN